MDDKWDSSDERTETGMKKAAGAILAAFLTGAGAVSALAAEGYANGGYWSNQDTMEWTLQNGTAEVYGRGPVFSELHPEITDPEHYLEEKFCLNRAEDDENREKESLTEEEEKRLKEFLHSFDWIHSDEVSRAQKAYERIANGHSGNQYKMPDPSLRSIRFPVLTGGFGLCENFAGEYAALAELMGLQCEAYDSDLNHRACLLKIDDRWFRVDPTCSSAFFSNASFYPVDYEKEKRRIGEASKEKWDTYFKEHPDRLLEEDFLMMDRLARGEITAEEYNSWAKHYYK